VARLETVAAVAKASKRQAALVGRSLWRIYEAAKETGYLRDIAPFISEQEAAEMPRHKVLMAATGSQGEPRAALARIARDDHRDLTLSEGDTVIFSSKIIPGNERGIFALINDLVDLGVKVITEKDAFTHVSGHPNRDELKRMYEWVRPRYSIPVHGEARHLERHADFALTLGVKDAIAPRNGDLIRLAPGEPEVIDEVPAGRWLLDGDLLLPEGASPMRERRKLGVAGAVSVAIALDEHGDLAAVPGVAIVGGPREAPGVDDVRGLVADKAGAAARGLSKKQRLDDEAVELAVTRAVRTVMTGLWGKRPAVAVLIQRV
jgi:ribonuclease J